MTTTDTPSKSWTVAQLKTYATENGISLAGTSTKTDILDRVLSVPPVTAVIEDEDEDEGDVDPMYPAVMNGRPRFLVIEAKLHVQTSSQGELVLPLDIPTKVFRKIGGDQEELDQLFSILEALGDSTASEKLENLGILETMGVVVRFFEEFEKKAKASMGESARSSK